MISHASKVAQKSECNFQHGAVIVRAGSVLAAGYNNDRAHPSWGGGPFDAIHAEAAAIRMARSKGCSLEGATLYVVRYHESGMRMSRPCPDCMDKIREAGIKKIVYSDRDGDIKHEKVR